MRADHAKGEPVIDELRCPNCFDWMLKCDPETVDSSEWWFWCTKCGYREDILERGEA